MFRSEHLCCCCRSDQGLSYHYPGHYDDDDDDDDVDDDNYHYSSIGKTDAMPALLLLSAIGIMMVQERSSARRLQFESAVLQTPDCMQHPTRTPSQSRAVSKVTLKPSKDTHQPYDVCCSCMSFHSITHAPAVALYLLTATTAKIIQVSRAPARSARWKRLGVPRRPTLYTGVLYI